jgi:2,3-dihydroxybenzoate-AMP ligase
MNRESNISNQPEKRETQNHMLWSEERIHEYIVKGYWHGTTIGEILNSTAEKHPEKVALVDEKERVTYRQIMEKVGRLALGFLTLGIRKGDRVIIQLPNWVECVYSLFALSKIGALPVLVLRQHRTKEIGFFADLTEATGIIIPKRFRDFDYIEMVEQLRPRLPSLKYTITVGGKGPPWTASLSGLLDESYEEKDSSSPLVEYKPGPKDIAFLLTTGGTTALSKVVPHTHNTIICYTFDGIAVTGVGSNSVYLLNQSWSHMGGLMRTLGALVSGGTLILNNRYSPEEILELIHREKVTNIQMVPTIALDIINYPELTRYNLNSLKVVECGAARLEPEVARKIMAKLCPKLTNGYGGTEGMHSRSRLDDPLEVTCNTVGKPTCPGAEIKIIDDKGEMLPPGKEGELLWRGPEITTHYYRNPGETKEAFDSQGFFHTGDIAVIDGEGNLRIIGRKKEMIMRGAENISPLEIEELLAQHPKVAGIAVIGIPDFRLGEKVCACIKPKAGEEISFEEVVAFLKSKGLANFKLPEKMELIDEFPLTPMLKISKRELKEQIIQKLREGGK